VLLIKKLREYCNYSEREKRYLNTIEFTHTSLYLMAESPMELRLQTFNELRDSYLNALNKGEPTDKQGEKLLELLDRSVSESLFARIKSAMNFRCKNTLIGLLTDIELLSMIEEGRKPLEKRSKETEAVISFVYRRLGFDNLEKEFTISQDKGDATVDVILSKARENVAEYCCALHIPMNEDDTLSPFLLSQIDALIAANERLIKNLRRIQFDCRQKS